MDSSTMAPRVTFVRRMAVSALGVAMAAASVSSAISNARNLRGWPEAVLEISYGGLLAIIVWVVFQSHLSGTAPDFAVHRRNVVRQLSRLTYLSTYALFGESALLALWEGRSVAADLQHLRGYLLVTMLILIWIRMLAHFSSKGSRYLTPAAPVGAVLGDSTLQPSMTLRGLPLVTAASLQAGLDGREVGASNLTAATVVEVKV